MADLRFKLTDNDRTEILNLWKSGLHTYNDLARLYNVCAKTIRLIVNPDYKKHVQEYSAENWRRFYNKERHRKNTRNYRNRLTSFKS